MKRIIELHEEKLLPPDTPFNDNQLTGSFAIKNLAIQDPEMKTRKVETYDKISLDTSVYGGNLTTTVIASPVVKKPVKAVTKKPIQIKREKSKTPLKQQFRGKINVHPKRKIEAVPVIKKSSGPVITKRAIIPDKRTTRTRLIQAKSSGYNKLYDV